MTLKRNIPTILYTVLFLSITGFGLFQMINLTVSTAQSKYLVSGVLVFGLILYLLIAFFAKEADILRVVQKKSVLFLVFELLLVVVCCGLLLYIYGKQHGMFFSVTFSLLLFGTYVVARLCGGRLCGFLSIVTGFYLFLTLVSSDMLQVESAVDTLCFLVPFILFLAIQRVLIPTVGENAFLVVASYLILSFLFSLAISLNPLVFILLAGCVVSLLFSAPEKDTCSKFGKGFFCAAYLILFTAVLLFCIHIFIPNILQFSTYALDGALPLEWNMNTLHYVLGKYTRPITYLYLPFSLGIFPTIMLFFAFLAGYYTIRNKTSYMGPALLSFVAMFAYYILFCEGGSQFYYLTYLLPFFAAYGISNTLVSDNEKQVTSEQSVPDELPLEELLQEEEPTGKETSIPDKSEDIQSTEQKSEKKVEIAPIPVNNVIPEWTISEEFLEEHPKEDSHAEEENILEEDSSEDIGEQSVLKEPSKDSGDLEQLITREQDETMSDDILSPKQEEVLDQLEFSPEQDEISDNDIEQFISEAAQADVDSIVDLSFVDSSDETSLETDETQLHDLLDRLDMAEPIKRMNESAQEDMADVIEREEEQVELSEALPLKPSKSTLPKYKRPDFDFEIEPVNIPLDDQYSNISEYDEVPTIHDLEKQWKSDSKPVIETIATEVEEFAEDNPSKMKPTEMETHNTIHSEEIVRKNGIGKRSYHKITIR